jgi:hypothetical protein
MFVWNLFSKPLAKIISMDIFCQKHMATMGRGLLSLYVYTLTQTVILKYM